MTQPNQTVEPDWETPLSFSLTPSLIFHAFFTSADTVHTGWDSCIDPALLIEDMTVIDEHTGNHCRLVKQAYVEDEEPELTWHDWTVELKVGDTYLSAHWRAQAEWSPSDQAWCTAQAEDAFSNACTLVGKRVRRGLLVEEPSRGPQPSRTRH
jgi:hypothetical protein